MIRRLAIATLAFGASALPALAHPGAGAHISLVSGLMHPISGLDHVLAMLAVGLWAALSGGRALWLLPTAFVAAMMAGYGAAAAGIGLPFVEPAILASVIVLGLVVVAALKVSTSAGMAFVGFLALFHGHAHGSEATAGLISFGAGFAASTIALHLAGIGLALMLGGTAGRSATRVAGAATALAGIAMAFSA